VFEGKDGKVLGTLAGQNERGYEDGEGNYE
jgi:hypothetical protein